MDRFVYLNYANRKVSSFPNGLTKRGIGQVIPKHCAEHSGGSGSQGSRGVRRDDCVSIHPQHALTVPLSCHWTSVDIKMLPVCTCMSMRLESTSTGPAPIFIDAQPGGHSLRPAAYRDVTGSVRDSVQSPSRTGVASARRRQPKWKASALHTRCWLGFPPLRRRPPRSPLQRPPTGGGGGLPRVVGAAVAATIRTRAALRGGKEAGYDGGVPLPTGVPRGLGGAVGDVVGGVSARSPRGRAAARRWRRPRRLWRRRKRRAGGGGGLHSPARALAADDAAAGGAIAGGSLRPRDCDGQGGGRGDAAYCCAFSRAAAATVAVAVGASSGPHSDRRAVLRPDGV